LYNYSYARILIGKLNEDGNLEYLNGISGEQKTIGIELNLDAGIYWAVVIID